jgi:hypothetical protein
MTVQHDRKALGQPVGIHGEGSLSPRGGFFVARFKPDHRTPRLRPSAKIAPLRRDEAADNVTPGALGIRFVPLLVGSIRSGMSTRDFDPLFGTTARQAGNRSAI